MKIAHSVVLASLPVVFSVGAVAQSTANLSGTVTDPSGAVVANVHVKVHSLATGQDREIVTDSAGIYAVPSLQPGDYKLDAVAPGFSEYVVSKVTLDVDQSVTVNMKLAVNSAGTTVEVDSGASAQIETQTMTVGQVINRETVQDLPLNGRHFLDLTTLTPGGVVADTAGSLTGASRGLGANSFLTAGNREDSVNFQINGVNLNDMSQNQITFQPSISTTSEFKIDNSTFSAEYGRSSGSIVNVSTRSGTNQFHGEVFDYFRNSALDARNYFNRPVNEATGASLGVAGHKAPLIRNNFGISVGGPIWKDRTFFYASYEGLRQQQGILQNSTVLSDAATTSVNASGQTVYSPNQRAAVAAAGSPAANALLAIIPLPNSGNNFVGFTPGPVQIDQGTMDVLQIINQKDQLHGFYAFQADQRIEPALQGDTVPGFGDHRDAHRQVGTLNETHIFSPSFVNEARLGFNRIAIAFSPNFVTPPGTYDIADGQGVNAGIPQTTFSDIGLTIGGPSGFPQGRDDTMGIFSDTATKLKGKNTIKFGGEFRRFLEASFTGDTGTLTYATSLTTSTVSAAAAQAATQGDNFEQDQASGFSITPNTIVSRVYINAVGAFLQDNYRLTQRLTLEGGLRFEWNGTPVEGENRFILFEPSTVSLDQVGTNGYGSPYKQNYNVDPRLGFAYDVFGTGRTVIRGGYSIMADQPVEDVVSGLTSNPPLSKKVSFTGSATNTIPVGALYSSALLAGFSLSSVNPNFRNAYMETYNFNVQQALPWGMVGSLGYYGSEGHHLRIATNENQPFGTTPRPFLTLSGTSPLEPGASINSNITEANSSGFSNYNAMWAVLTKTTTHGLEFNMNYEWEKSMDSNSLGSQGGLNLQDSNNVAGNYGLSDFDVRQHYAGTAIYNLPFKRNFLVSGYQLSAIVQYQTGNPVNITANSDSFTGVAGVVRPNIVGKVNTHKLQASATTNVNFISNPAGTICNESNVNGACVFEIVGTSNTAGYNGLGDIQRNAVTGPGFADMDVSGEKDTKLFENVLFKLRVDAFDILNHPNFGQPSGNVNSSTFGQISSTRFATSDGGSSRQLQVSGKFTF